MKDNKNIIIGLLVFIIIILLVFIGLLVSGTILISSFNCNEINNNQSNNNQENIDDNQYVDWMNYILSSDIQSISLKRSRVAVNEGENDYRKDVSLNEDDLKNIFNKIQDSQFIKKYTLGMGIADGDVLTVSYNMLGTGGLYPLALAT